MASLVAVPRRPSSRIVSCLGLLATLAVASSVEATVTQPNGVVMPKNSNNGETQIFTMFQQRGEPINWLTDAHTVPATFSPLCDFQATFVLKQSGSSLAVGWYNVLPNMTTAPQPGGGPNGINIVVPAGSPVGTIITGATIKGDPNYAGGYVGFALVGGQTHYTEPRWDPPCNLSNPPKPWISAVIYASQLLPNAYYVAFEDGDMNPFSFGNDGDYNDYVYLFEGLVCSGGGADCATGQPGVCAPGITSCSGACGPLVPASAEKCNGLDDDCNNLTDDNAPCPPSEICDKGVCVPKCGGGEFKCPVGTVCNADGYCVDPACQTVTCDAGKVCIAGVCIAPCDNVVCPVGQQCHSGRCVDPCAGVTCPGTQACMNGVCKTSCNCSPCSAGLGCDTVSGVCVDPSCVGAACGAGQACLPGSGCVDACQGAVCPAHQSCQTGSCVDDADAGTPAGGSSGNGGSAGAIVITGGTSGSSGSLGVGGTAASAGSNGSDASGGTAFGGSSGDSFKAADSSSGCGCRAPGSAHDDLALYAVGLGVAGLLYARRRRAA